MSTITIENHGGRYRLRWLYLGKRFTMGCGAPATPTGKAFAKQKVAQIEMDISAEYFGPSLLKYKPRTLGKTATDLTVSALFRWFTVYQAKEKRLAPGSLRRYVCVQAHAEKRLNVSAELVSDQHSALKPKSDDLVFSSPKGFLIHDNNFRNQAWKSILEPCRIEYRKPYAMSHSAISHALANGANYIQVAEAAGHNPKIMH